MDGYNSEQPIYVLPQVIKRALIPKIITLVGLGIIFFLGILLNLSLLYLNASEETVSKLVSLIILLSIVGVGIFLSFRRARRKYLFYRDRIVFGKKKVFYQSILEVGRKQNFFDKRFKTYSLVLKDGFNLNHISEEVDVESYVKKLVEYGKGS